MFSGKIFVKKLHVFPRKVARHGRKASPVRKNKVNAKVMWSELNEDLLGEIMSRLCLTDQARFRAVCRRWHSVHPITTYNSLPWFVSIERYPSAWSNSLKYRMHEPYSSSGSRILTHNMLFSELSVPCSLLPVFVEVRHNWLVISVCQENWPNATVHNAYFILFSPLTRKLIQLPKLDYQAPRFSNFIHSFSTNPDSPDCVFLVSYFDYKREFFVRTCYQGDKEWTLRKFNYVVDPLYLAEYINGTFFVVCPRGQLVSFNTMNGEFEIEKEDIDDDFDQLFYLDMGFLMFELNGELMVLYIGIDDVRGDYTTFPDMPCIKKFDWPTKAWIPLRSLRDQTLFVGHRISSVVKVGKEEARNMGVLSNAIYYYFDLGCIIYTFVNGDLVLFKFNPASKNTVKSGDLLQFQYDSVVKDTRWAYAWLEPPVI